LVCPDIEGEEIAEDTRLAADGHQLFRRLAAVQTQLGSVDAQHSGDVLSFPRENDHASCFRAMSAKAGLAVSPAHSRPATTATRPTDATPLLRGFTSLLSHHSMRHSPPFGFVSFVSFVSFVFCQNDNLNASCPVRMLVMFEIWLNVREFSRRSYVVFVSPNRLNTSAMPVSLTP
jgi:hypothetical protein